MTTADEARATLAALQAKLATETAREKEIAKESERQSFGALTDDAAARKALGDLDKEATSIGPRIKHARHAIQEAERRLAAAERNEALAAQRDIARRSLAIARSIEQRGRKLDEALLALAVEAEGFEDDLSTLNYELGLRAPNLGHFKAIVERPFFAALMFQPSGKLRQDGQPAPGTLKLRHIAPGERMTFAEIAGGYAKTIERSAALVLDDQASVEAA